MEAKFACVRTLSGPSLTIHHDCETDTTLVKANGPGGYRGVPQTMSLSPLAQAMMWKQWDER